MYVTLILSAIIATCLCKYIIIMHMHAIDYMPNICSRHRHSILLLTTVVMGKSYSSCTCLCKYMPVGIV